MQDLINEIQAKLQQLNKSIKMLRTTGSDYAKAEYDYKILLREECLKMRDEGMAIGMIDKTAYGVPSVAKKRMMRDIAEATYKANQEAIQAIKLEIRILDNQISREWGGGSD